jgi:hypothetical protein
MIAVVWLNLRTGVVVPLTREPDASSSLTLSSKISSLKFDATEIARLFSTQLPKSLQGFDFLSCHCFDT